MRKLFWSCFVCGVVVAAAVFTMAQAAVRHPDSILGQMMYGASRIAVAMNPFSGFAPALARLEKAVRTPASQDMGDEEPAEVLEPVEDLRWTVEPPLVAEVAPSMPILIPDDELIPAAPMPIRSDTLVPVQHVEPFAGAECPPAEHAAAPAMPRCEEESEATENFERIGTDFNKPETLPTLPMPTAEEEQEEAECPLGCGDRLLRMFEKMLKRELCPTEKAPTTEEGQEEQEEPASKPECREDPYHHHHYQGCPGTGRCYPMGCPGMHSHPYPPAEPAEEEQAEPMPEAKKKRKKIRRYKTRIESCPSHTDVDTMEFRATDRMLYDFGPGKL